MNQEKARWGVSQSDLEHLSAELRPMRSSREVGVILGLSTSLVCKIEIGALRKVVRALKRLDGQCKPQQNNVDHEE